MSDTLERAFAAGSAEVSIADDARRAADLVWSDDPAAEDVIDPRLAIFAQVFVEASTQALDGVVGLIRRSLEGAGRSAEGANVDPFQGLVEIVQNADDLDATEVRIQLRATADGGQLLVAHNGRPVTCHHVPGLVLPYVTSKQDDPDARGRFGIGLKTLRRISNRMSVHSAPYHFEVGPGVSLRPASPELDVQSVYSRGLDTLFVLDLKDDFDEAGFQRWLDAWRDDNLLFLDNVRRLIFVGSNGSDIAERTTAAGPWVSCLVSVEGAIRALERRQVKAGDQRWDVVRALIEVPHALSRAHKRTADLTPVSVATSPTGTGGIYIGFRTRVAADIPFAIDAQFDPSNGRETIIENAWNGWLIARCGDVVAAGAIVDFAMGEPAAWKRVPLDDEQVGGSDELWPRQPFDAAFANARQQIAQRALVPAGSCSRPLASFAYEASPFTGLLDNIDLDRLTGGAPALRNALRDEASRWRSALTSLAVGVKVGTPELLAGFAAGHFEEKSASWWVRAAGALIACAQPAELIAAPIWLTRDLSAVSCGAGGSRHSTLVLNTGESDFARRHRLFHELHPAYGSMDAESLRVWLVQHAAFRTVVDAEEELLTFAARNAWSPKLIGDGDLTDIRDLFDQLPNSTAERVGPQVGAAIKIDAVEYRRGKPIQVHATPATVHLPRSIDTEGSPWPAAAGELAGFVWAAPSYEARLKTGLGRQRKRDGIMPRGARRFLILLGAASGPRLVASPATTFSSPTRRAELLARGANQVSEDWASPDIERVLQAIEGGPKRQMKLRRERSLALLRTLSRDWSGGLGRRAAVAAQSLARVRATPRGEVAAQWVCRLRDAAWVAVGRQRLQPPGGTPLKNAETLGVYDPDEFAALGDSDRIDPACARALGFATSVEVSRLIAALKAMRDGGASQPAQVRQIYRQLSALAPKLTSWSAFGDLSLEEVRRRFGEGHGLVAIFAPGVVLWRRPDQLRRGRPVIPEPFRFVPDGEVHGLLWTALGIVEPTVSDCVDHLERHAQGKRPGEDDGVLIELYRLIETKVAKATPADLDRLRILPLAVGDRWWTRRPILLLEDPLLRDGLAAALPHRRFWSPPCDVTNLPNFVDALQLKRVSPLVRPRPDASAVEVGQDEAVRFRRAVDYLSDALGRSGTDLRRQLKGSWDDLRVLPLFIYAAGVELTVDDPVLGQEPARAVVRAYMHSDSLQLHVMHAAIGDRDEGGRAIASLFARSCRRTIEAEWSSAWSKSLQPLGEVLKFRADDAEAQASLAELAAEVAQKRGLKVQITAPGTVPATQLPPRRLKTTQPGVGAVSILTGSPPRDFRPAVPPSLHHQDPGASAPSPRQPMANTEYDNVDLESRGWEVLTHVLSTVDGPQLDDFRRVSGVGADGSIAWRQFVELKASGRSCPSAVAFPNTEFGRALKEGQNYILALVWGLEEDHETQVKLIFDPVRTAGVTEVNSLRLSGLGDAAGVLVRFNDDGTVSTATIDPAGDPATA